MINKKFFKGISINLIINKSESNMNSLKSQGIFFRKDKLITLSNVD